MIIVREGERGGEGEGGRGGEGERKGGREGGRFLQIGVFI